MNALSTLALTLAALAIEPPTELEPVSMSAELSTATASPGDTLVVTVGIKLLPGWRIYAHVPANEPYVQTRWLVDLPPRLSAAGEWIGPPPTPDVHNPELKLYEAGPDALLLMRELKVADDAQGSLTVNAGLLYQACDFSRCLPPTRKTVELKLKIVPQAE
jgi:DsbC/DsbD-like thiol-disulfide interchange protein